MDTPALFEFYKILGSSNRRTVCWTGFLVSIRIQRAMKRPKTPRNEITASIFVGHKICPECCTGWDVTCHGCNRDNSSPCIFGHGRDLFFTWPCGVTPQGVTCHGWGRETRCLGTFKWVSNLVFCGLTPIHAIHFILTLIMF